MEDIHESIKLKPLTKKRERFNAFLAMNMEVKIMNEFDPFILGDPSLFIFDTPKFLLPKEVTKEYILMDPLRKFFEEVLLPCTTEKFIPVI